MNIKIIFFILFSSVSLAQIKFESGYYKDNNGTVVNCMIKNKDAYNNPTFIEIKTNDKDELKIKTIAEISEFRIDGYPKYIRSTVDIDDYEDSKTSLNVDKDPVISKKTIFLKLESEGDANLYSYVNEKIIKFYFSKENGPIKLLLFKKYYSDNGRIFLNNAFHQQLADDLTLNSEQLKMLLKLRYNLNNLKSFFKLVTKNQKDVVEINKKEKRKAFNFYIKGGPVFNSYESLTSLSGKQNFAFPAQTTLGAGFEIEHVLNFNKNKWAVFIEPFYESFSSTAPAPKISAINQTAVISLQIINLGLGAKHIMFVKDDSAFFVSVAGQIAWAVGNSNFVLNDTQMRLNEINFGLSSSIGYRYKKFILEYRFRSPLDLTDEKLGYKTGYASSTLVFGYNIF